MKYINRIRNTSLEIEESFNTASSILKKPPENVRREDLARIRKIMADVNSSLGWIQDSVRLNLEVLVAELIEEKMIMCCGYKVCFNSTHFYEELNCSKYEFETCLNSLKERGLLWFTLYFVFRDGVNLGQRRVMSYDKIPSDHIFTFEGRHYRKNRRKKRRD